VLVIVPRLKPGFGGGTAPFSQFKGPWKTTFRFTLVVTPPPSHTTILALSMRTLPLSSSILRLTEVGSENSPGSQVAPEASTACRIMTIFLVLSDPFPPVPTFLRAT
jgi:hypothetical protein